MCGYYDVQIKRAEIREGIMMLKRKGGWKRGQYDVQLKRVAGYGRAL